jgi:hypothetical protein
MLEALFRAARSRRVEYDGKTVYLYDRLAVPERCRLLLCFEQVHSPWRQGVWLGDLLVTTSLRLTVAGQTAPGMFFWADTSPPEVLVDVATPRGEVCVYNVWDTGNGRTQSQLGGAGMLIEELNGSEARRYFCNDGHPETTFANLIFTLKVLE